MKASLTIDLDLHDVSGFLRQMPKKLAMPNVSLRLVINGVGYGMPSGVGYGMPRAKVGDPMIYQKM